MGPAAIRERASRNAGAGGCGGPPHRPVHVPLGRGAHGGGGGLHLVAGPHPQSGAKRWPWVCGHGGRGVAGRSAARKLLAVPCVGDAHFEAAHKPRHDLGRCSCQRCGRRLASGRGGPQPQVWLTGARTGVEVDREAPEVSTWCCGPTAPAARCACGAGGLRRPPWRSNAPLRPVGAAPALRAGL